MFRHRRGDANRLLVLRNRNSDLAGMQMKTRLAEARPITVNIIADDRPALGCRMHPQLMGAAGDGLKCKPAEAVGATHDFPVGDGRLAIRVYLLPPAALGVEPAERHVNRAFIFRWATFDSRPIGF